MTNGNPDTRPRRGCLFYTFIIASILLLLVLAGGLAGWRYAKKMLNDFTAPAPEPVPVVTLPPAELGQLHRRVDTFRDAVITGRETPPLTLSADEINALISSEPDSQALKGKLYVTLEGDQVKAQVSFPMDMLNLSIFRGRYLNGTARLGVSFADGTLRITPTEIQVNGKPLPDVYMQSIRRQNLAAGIQDDPRSSAALEKLKEIYVRDGKLVVVPKDPRTALPEAESNL